MAVGQKIPKSRKKDPQSMSEYIYIYIFWTLKSFENFFFLEILFSITFLYIFILFTLTFISEIPIIVM